MAVLTTLTVLSGFNGTINSISLVVPFLLVSAVGTGILSLFIEPEKTALRSFALIPASSGTGFGQPSCTLPTTRLYPFPYLVRWELGQKQEGHIIRRDPWGSWPWHWSLRPVFSIRHHFTKAAGMEVPMIYIAGRVSPAAGIIYGIVLLAEIYTTAVGNLYGLSARISASVPWNSRDITVISALCAFLISLLGFSNLVRYLYPSVGYAGIITLTSLVINRKNSIDKK